MKQISNQIARGGVLLLGSLLWEGEKKSDANSGAQRKKWRDDHLNLNKLLVVNNLPLRYGRKSKKRGGEFTMILRPYQKRGSGRAKAAPFRKTFNIGLDDQLTKEAQEALQEEVGALARAEGIWKDDNKSHISIDDYDESGRPLSGKPWGIVALWANPNTKEGKVIAAHWRKKFALPKSIHAKPFGNLVNKHGLLTLPWPNDLGTFDFCLCTPTRPNVKYWSYAVAAKAIGNGNYFDRTTIAGIYTSDDTELRRRMPRSATQHSQELTSE